MKYWFIDTLLFGPAVIVMVTHRGYGSAETWDLATSPGGGGGCLGNSRAEEKSAGPKARLGRNFFELLEASRTIWGGVGASRAEGSAVRRG